MAANVLTDPDVFFRERAENPGFLRPLGVVFLAAIAAVIGPLILYRSFLAAGASGIASIGFAGAVIGGFFGQFIMWVVLAIVFYLISIAVGGSGSFRDTLKLTGWGFVPSIIAGIVSAIGTYIALQSVAVPSLPNINFQNPNPQQIQALTETLASFQVAVGNQPAVRIATLVAIALLIWQGVIWVYAMKYARALSLRGAVIAVWIPVGLYVLYQLANLLGGWVV